MTKFEKQLRQWFPSGEFWGTPVYTGKTMLSRLDDNLLVKVSFIHTKIAQHYDALRVKIMNRTEGEIDSQVYVSFDDVLEIANYFGVSFESCLYRLAYVLRVIDGNIEPDELAKRTARYAPEKRRKERGMDYVALYEDLVDAYADVLSFSPSEHARLVFQSDYIYHDSRMEGVNTTPEEAAEIVTDLRLNAQKSNTGF